MLIKYSKAPVHLVLWIHIPIMIAFLIDPDLLHQRNSTSFNRSIISEYNTTERGCLEICHTFRSNRCLLQCVSFKKMYCYFNISNILYLDKSPDIWTIYLLPWNKYQIPIILDICWINIHQYSSQKKTDHNNDCFQAQLSVLHMIAMFDKMIIIHFIEVVVVHQKKHSLHFKWSNYCILIAVDTEWS